MQEKLKHFLTMPTESNPVWLDKGEAIAYIRKDDEGTNIWKLVLATGEREKLTKSDTRIWSIESRAETDSIYFALDENGHECEQFFLLQANDKSIRQLTNEPEVRHLWGGVNADGNKIAYASNARVPETFDIWTMDLASKEQTLAAQHVDNYNWPPSGAMSPDGRYLLYNKLRAESDNAMWMTDLSTGQSIRIPNDRRVSAEITPAWKHDSSGFYLLSDRDSEFYYVCYYDLKSKAMSTVHMFDWDVEGLSLSYDDRFLAVLINADGYTDLHIYDVSGTRPVRKQTALPPKGVISAYERASWSPNDHRLLFSLSSGTRPVGLWILDLNNNALTQLSENVIPATLQDDMVEPQLCRFDSFDELSVPYWLYVPNGREAKDLPVVIDIHGGPEGQELPTFNAFVQFLLAEGLAVVAPNVRGSTGYGKTYTHLDDVEKRLDSVKDIDALVKHLVESEIANKDSIAVTGVSYGGFMTLSCAGRLPNLWACAIATVGMYNLVTFLENTADYRRAHRESEYGSLEHDRDLLWAVSPVAKFADIKAPMMVIQGKNDPRVPVTEAEQAVDALKEMGREVVYLCYEDEGHGIAKLKNRLDCYPQMAVFLKKYLLG